MNAKPIEVENQVINSFLTSRSIRKAAKSAGVARNTARRIIRKEGLSLTIKASTPMPTPAKNSGVNRASRCGNGSHSHTTYLECSLPHRYLSPGTVYLPGDCANQSLFDAGLASVNSGGVANVWLVVTHCRDVFV